MTSGGKFAFRVVLTGAALLIGAAVHAQSAGSSGLVVQVNPEAHLSPSAAALAFQVTNPGDTVASQPVTVTAWVRSLPNQQIQLTAQPVSLTGPSGSVALSALHWNGSVMQATGGGTAAACTNGVFGNGPAAPLIASWTQSGIVTCSVTFSLATEDSWPAGSYKGQIGLSLFAQ